MRNLLSIEQLGLAAEAPSPVLPTAQSYRPPSWPPPRDWVCIEDKDQNIVSRWGDPIWHLWPWAESRIILNYGDGPKLIETSSSLDRQNADLLRLVMTWKIWGFRGFKSHRTIENYFTNMKLIFVICSRNGILASDLSRFPRVIDEIAKALPPSEYCKIITKLDALLHVKELIGFTLFDAAGIAQLKASQPQHQTRQTGYIPPRIWTYQVTRLKEFLEDYLLHQKQIENCFSFCVDAYLTNQIAQRRKSGVSVRYQTPFSGRKRNFGSFSDVAERFEIKGLLEKWMGNLDKSRLGVRMLSKYLTMASYVGMSYTLNFTFARNNEIYSIRFNCLKWHDDEKYGRIPLIEGPTTKIFQDSSALWVTSPSVEAAIKVMQSVAKLRSPFIPSNSGEENIRLMNFGLEPWCAHKTINSNLPRNSLSYAIFISEHPLLFDKESLLITEEDFKIALSVNPTLDKKIYQIGKPWLFRWHQLRRTGAVNMFSSGKISNATIQLQLKHLNPISTNFYCRGSTALNLNEEVKTLIINAQYEAMGIELSNLNSDDFISPYGLNRKKILLAGASANNPVNLITENDAAHYEKAARNHQINFRRTAVGGCMKNGRCDGDGYTSISDCTGGDGRSPCMNSIFDTNRAAEIKVRLNMVISQIESLEPDSPRYKYLEKERRGMENYFAHINQK